MGMIQNRPVTNTGPERPMIQNRPVTNTGPERPFRCLDYSLELDRIFQACETKNPGICTNL